MKDEEVEQCYNELQVLIESNTLMEHDKQLFGQCQQIIQESMLDGLFTSDLQQELKNYKTLFAELENHGFICDIENLYEALDGSSWNIEGYVEVTKKQDEKNNLFLTFTIHNVKHVAQWQEDDGYAVWQTTTCAEDDFSGYLLFPTEDENKYFCISYEC